MKLSVITRAVCRCIELAVMVSLGFGVLLVGAAGNAQDMASAAAHGSTAQLPTWLWGEWSRDWIQKGKVKSNTLDVHYLQTPTYFADIRIPKDQAGISTAKSFADLTDQQLRLLARQNGYAGRTTMEGTVATWHEDILFQPSDGTPDMGRLQRIPPDRMHEHGLDGSYIESWRLLTGGNGRFLVIRVEHSGRLLRTLVVVGDEFAYVRNRAKDLPMARSFDALIEATNATREQIVEYLDCEFSVGRVRGGSVPWEIEQSTLPWREGRRLDFVEQMSISDGAASLVPREVGEDQWTVPVNTLSPGEIKALFGGESKPAS
ncbi:MAG: hypothetical protein ACLQU2_17370 [Candidatus Binataceae bacterium]